MPKKGNVKKNVSKQVKKDKQQKGGGPVAIVKERIKNFKNIFLRKSSDIKTEGFSKNGGVIADNHQNLEQGPTYNNKIEIVCSDKLIKYSDDLHTFWADAQKLKNLNKKPHDNDYYIDTFLSKQILEVLLDHYDKYESIIYVENSSIEKVPDNYHSCFSPSPTKDKDTTNIKRIKPIYNIKNIDINDLNTFAITETEQISHGRWQGEEEIENRNKITFPTKLIFELTQTEGSSTVDELLTLATYINGEIAERIDSAITDLKEKYSLKKEEIRIIELKISDEKRANQRKLAEEQENYISDFTTYLSNKYGGSEQSWRSLVRLNPSAFEKIINDLKKCEAQTDGAQGDGIQGGKKHSKKEVLGKMMVIYKIKGERKEYVKHKGKLITIRDYKALMKQKAKK